MNGNRVTIQRVPYLHLELECDPRVTGDRTAQSACLERVRAEFLSWLTETAFDVNVVTLKVRNAHPSSTKPRKEYKPKAGGSDRCDHKYRDYDIWDKPDRSDVRTVSLCKNCGKEEGS